MIEVFRSNRIFELNLLRQKLEEVDIPAVIMDEHTGGLMHGIGDISPRLMVLDEDLDAARAIISEFKER